MVIQIKKKTIIQKNNNTLKKYNFKKNLNLNNFTTKFSTLKDLYEKIQK